VSVTSPHKSSLRLSDFDYVLPTEQIAQAPLPARDQSRLLVLGKTTGAMAHRHFGDLPELLEPGDVLVVNDTRVTALRLFGKRPGHPQERIETFLTHSLGDGKWQALARPARKLPPGAVLCYADGLSAQVLAQTDTRGGRLLQFQAPPGARVDDLLAAQGSAPLPPYITQALPPENRERYQTVYAARGGSAAAPTAGLHFTPDLLARVQARGVQIAHVTLHVGLGTFRPIETEDVADHIMHHEHITVTPQAADIVNNAQGRIVAVGTTSARTLESAAVASGRIRPLDGDTDLFILPGYPFKVVDALITNFHMPRSTLLLLISALAGQAAVRAAYAEALAQGYRFLSFGDAMLIA